MEMERDEEQLPSLQSPAPVPWGLWATLGFSVLLVGIYFIVQIFVAFAFMVYAMQTDPDLKLFAFLDSMATDGDFLSLATLITNPICIVIIIVFVALRKNITLRQYLALNGTSVKKFVLCLGALFLFLLVTMPVNFLADTSSDYEFMMNTYSSAEQVFFLWITLVVAAPVFEELFFRGFLFAGILHSRLGATGAIFLTSLLWAVIHIQYELAGIAVIFLAGLLIGTVRVRMNSVYPCIAMHALMNLLSTIEIALLQE